MISESVDRTCAYVCVRAHTCTVFYTATKKITRGMNLGAQAGRIKNAVPEE